MDTPLRLRSRPNVDRDEGLAAELRASFVFVIGTMAVLLLVSIIGIALT
ncbi:MAG: hypothetical protein ACM3WR_01330 [Solirubrobacterales bacterium]|jgi:hypothetical protein